MLAHNAHKYLLNSGVQFVSQLPRAGSVCQISVNLKLPQHSNPGLLCIYFFAPHRVCLFEKCAGEVPAHHTGPWGSSIPSLVLYHLVCLHGV